MPVLSAPRGQPYANQNSPATLGLYLVIDRGPDYSFDMTTVTTVSVALTFPDGTTATWSLTPIPSMTTASQLVASRAYDPATKDTAQLGNTFFVATPFIGSTPLPPMHGVLPVRGPALG